MINNNKYNIINNTYLILFIVFLIGFIVFLIGFIYYCRRSNKIKDKTNYDLDDVRYIDDFDVNSLKITKKESRIGANIYYTRCALNLDDDIIIS